MHDVATLTNMSPLSWGYVVVRTCADIAMVGTLIVCFGTYSIQMGWATMQCSLSAGQWFYDVWQRIL